MHNAWWAKATRVVVCDNLRSLHNVGAVFRTADAAGWGGVLLGGYTGAPPDRRIEKVSLGAEASLAWAKREDLIVALTELKAAGFVLVGLEQTADATDILTHTDTSKKLALVLGNEVEGIRPEVLEVLDACVQIPMRGIKQSLNVSVACGVALYALRDF